MGSTFFVLPSEVPIVRSQEANMGESSKWSLSCGKCGKCGKLYRRFLHDLHDILEAPWHGCYDLVKSLALFELGNVSRQLEEYLTAQGSGFFLSCHQGPRGHFWRKWVKIGVPRNWWPLNTTDNDDSPVDLGWFRGFPWFFLKNLRHLRQIQLMMAFAISLRWAPEKSQGWTTASWCRASRMSSSKRSSQRSHRLGNPWYHKPCPMKRC